MTSATQSATKTLGDRMMRASGDRPWRTPTCWSPTSATMENETLQAHSKQAGRRQSGLQIKKVSAKKSIHSSNAPECLTVLRDNYTNSFQEGRMTNYPGEAFALTSQFKQR